MVKRQKQMIWSYYKGRLGWAIYNEKYKYISHYEETEIQAYRICREWNKKGREF